MTRLLWILAVATLAVQLALLLFGGVIIRALAAAGWSPFQLGTTLSLPMDALLVVTAGTGIYTAGKAHRGGWIALFAVVLALGLYGPYAAGILVLYVRLGGLPYYVYLEALDLVLDALVPLVALAYALRYRAGPDALARVGGA